MKENRDKLKIVFICHFSTSAVREKMPLDDRKLYIFVRKMLGMPQKSSSYGDIAPWVTNMVDNLKTREDIELHVISAHTGLKRMKVSFELDNVHYYFVKADYTTLMKRLIKNDALWRKLNPMRFVVKRIVDKISPDIVNLIGAENAYISGTILDIQHIPIFVMCQTIYNNPDRSKYGIVDSKNATTEKLIVEKESYFAVQGKMHNDLLLKMKPNNIFIFQWSPSTPYPQVKNIVKKKYDFVNFAATLSYTKGFHDSIQALAIVKEKYPDVRLNLVGGGSTEIKEELEKLIESSGLVQNVEFTPFFEKQEDMLQHIQNARFAVLPCKMDNISGTMLQAMYYGLPLVVYKTSGTPSLNKYGESVLVVEHNNIELLAENMLILMDNPEKAESLRQNAEEYMRKTNDDKKETDKLIANYKAIISHYNGQIPIPEHFLYKV